MESLTVNDHSFQNVKSVTISDNPQLSTISFRGQSFSNAISIEISSNEIIRSIYGGTLGKNNKIILYNDGPNIDKEVLNNIFTPYEKGVKGIFGLGLSIVQKTLRLLNYDITIENVKNGVKFIIS